MGRRVLRGLASTALVLGASTIALPARALEDYADEIAKRLELADKPSCHYCHAVGADGVATDTAFADALKTRGFSRRNGLPSLRRALTRLDEDGADSDGDGVGDVDELIAAANPNDPTDMGRPAQGCSLSLHQREPFAMCWLAALIVGWMRRRRERPLQRRVST